MLKIFKPVSLLLLAGVFGFSAQAEAALPEHATPATDATQQKTKVTGTVEDDLGPVTGATVLVKGTTNGTITDLDGNFTLEVKNGDIIQISFIGYATQEIKYTGQPSLKIDLKEDTQKLNEVVVTALGLKREEKALGYAVTELKGDELRSANTISPVASLQGKVAGVEIAQSDGGMFGATKIQIRGASTLSGNNQPIYVIDGVILDNNTSGNSTVDWEGNENSNDYGNELKNLNPDDFESVSVLKGAAATALYGSRGLNGAVVITTKTGKGTKGFGVTVSQTLGIDHAYKMPGIQTLYGDGYFPGNANYSADGNRWADGAFMTNSNGQHTVNGDGAGLAFGPRFDGSPIELWDGSMGVYSPVKNNMLDMYRLGFNTNTNVAVRGGNDKSSVYASVSYKKANGTTENNTFERYSMLLKATHKISDYVDIAGSVSFANSKPRNAARNVGEQFINGTYTQLYDPEYFRDKYLGEHGGMASTTYGDKYGNVPGKDYWFSINHKDQYRKETVVRPQLEVNVKILDWLKFKADANMNYYYTRMENKELGSGYANDGGYYGMSQDTKEQFTVGGTFTVSKQIKDFSVGGFARFEYYNNYQSSYSMNTKGGLAVPGQFFIGNSKETVNAEGKISGTKRIISAIFAVNLGWKNQLFLDVTGRNDWSSSLVYANKTGNYSYFYPSVSGSWLANETFELPEWVSLLKLRGSWAQVGNDTSPYNINSAYGFASHEMLDGYIYSNTLNTLMNNPNLKPERKNAWEIGLDARFLNSRINIDATYYRENTKDQIMDIAVPGISGVSTQRINAGNIQNEGIEIALNTVPYRNKDWEWTLDFTWTKNNSKIVELHPNVADFIRLSGYLDGDVQIASVAKVGGAYGLLMSQMLPKVDEATGQKVLNWNQDRRSAYYARSSETQEVGKMTPDFLGSVATGLTWKDLSLRIGLDMRVGGMTASYSNRYGTAYGYTETSLRYRDEEHGGMTWTSKWLNEDGTPSGSYGITYHDGMIPDGVFAAGQKITGADGKVHEVGGKSYRELYEAGILEPVHAGAYHLSSNSWGAGTVNDDWFHKLSYIALREITLAYRIPKNISSKVGAKNLGVSFTARNLGYLYNSLPNNLNPESTRGNVSHEFRSRGFEPYIASYMMTVNVEF